MKSSAWLARRLSRLPSPPSRIWSLQNCQLRSGLRPNCWSVTFERGGFIICDPQNRRMRILLDGTLEPISGGLDALAWLSAFCHELPPCRACE